MGFRTSIVALTMVLGSAAAVHADYIGAVDAANPLAHYRYSETSGTTTNDSNLDGGATNNGAYVGSPVLGGAGPVPPTYGGFETGNTAVTLNGTNQYINLGTGLNSTLNNAFSAGGTGFTFLAWVSTNSTATQALFSTRSTNNQSNVVFQVNRNASDAQANGVLRLFLRNKDSFSGSNFATTGAVVPTNGDFAMVAVTYDPTATFNPSSPGATTAVKFYVNGTRVAGTNAGPETGTFNLLANTLIGASLNSSGNAGGFVSGKLDESSIFTTALTPTQIATLYAASVPEPSTAMLALAGAALILRRRE